MNYRELLNEMNRCNLCTYFILPLVGLTEKSFGGLFINSYLTREVGYIVVHVANLDLVSRACRQLSVHSWSDSSGGYLQYALENIWWYDLAKFCNGEYSRISSAAKKIINERSGLKYKETVNGVETTDFRLLALQGEKAVRYYWERELGAHLDVHQDLLSKPPESSFINVKRV